MAEWFFVIMGWLAYYHRFQGMSHMNRCCPDGVRLHQVADHCANGANYCLDASVAFQSYRSRASANKLNQSNHVKWSMSCCVSFEIGNRIPDWKDVEMLDCGVCWCRCCPNRRSAHNRSVLSMAVDMMWPRVRANSMANHGGPVNWPPLVCLALHHSPIFGHPTVWKSLSVESFSNVLVAAVRLKFELTFSCCICNFIWIVFFLSLHRLFWNQTRITRGDRPVISTNCSFIKASGRGFAL